MAYVYGTERRAGSYNFYFRSFMSYSVSTTNTEVSITITAGVQVTNGSGSAASGEVGWNDLTVKVEGTDKTTKTKTANYRTSKTDSSARQTYISSFTWTWSRTTSDTNKTVKVTLSGNFSSSDSVKSITVSVPTLPSYKITYNANGGGTNPESQTKYYGKALTLRTKGSLNRPDYTFLGWNTSASGSGTSYAAGGTYTANAAATLYANWRLDYYKPTFANLTCYRVNDADSRTDAGTYIHVGFTWTIGHIGTTEYPPTCVITIDNQTVYNQQLATSSSRTFSDYFGNEYSPTESHTIVVRLFDEKDSTGSTITGVVNTATYPIDLLADDQNVYMGVMHTAVSGTKLTTTDLHVEGALTSTGNVDTSGSYLMGGETLFKTNNTPYETISINSGTATSGNFAITTISGYTPVGMIGYDLNNSSSSGSGVTGCVPIQLQLTGTTFYYQIRNNGSATARIQLQVFILHVKTGLI